MKPTREQIEAEAKTRYEQTFIAGHGMGVGIFIEGVEYGLSQIPEDKVLKQLEDLRDYYERVTLDWVSRENVIFKLNKILNQ